jgi:hypothetical protein
MQLPEINKICDEGCWAWFWIVDICNLYNNNNNNNNNPWHYSSDEP